jgi:hypothetical protein
MPAASCPSCAARLTLPDDLAPGEAIRCPSCQTVFRPGQDDVPMAEEVPVAPVGAYQAPAAPVPRPQRARTESVLLEDDDFPEHSQPRRRGGHRRSRAWLWAGLSAGVLLLIGGVVFAVLMLTSGGGLSDELRYAPDRSRIVVSVDVRGVVNSAAFTKIRDTFRDLLGDGRGGGKDLETEIEQLTRLNLKEIQRVTVLGTWEGRGDDVTIVIKTRNAKNFKLPERGGNFPGAPKPAAPQTIGKYTLHSADRRTGYCIADDQTVVVGPVATMARVLERNGKAELSPGLERLLHKVNFSRSAAGAVDLRDLAEGRAFRNIDPELQQLLGRLDGAIVHISVGSDLRYDATLFGRDGGKVLASGQATLDVDLLLTVIRGSVLSRNRFDRFEKKKWDPKNEKKWDGKGDFDKGFKKEIFDEKRFEGPPTEKKAEVRDRGRPQAAATRPVNLKIIRLA